MGFGLVMGGFFMFLYLSGNSRTFDFDTHIGEVLVFLGFYGCLGGGGGVLGCGFYCFSEYMKGVV